MSSLFLFGAGASFGSGPCVPDNPPLGAQLFPALQANGGVAANVSPELAQLFVSDFEAGMDRFWTEHNSSVSALLRDMARFFAPFAPLPGNLYFELIKVLGGTRKKATFVTTNYDILIEHAVIKSGFGVVYRGIAVEKGMIPVLKIHGSCHFLPDMPANKIQLIDVNVAGLKTVDGKQAGIVEVPCRVAEDAQEVIDFCNTEKSLAPALAMYSPAKPIPYCQGFVEKQQKEWLIALDHAARIYVVGLRVHLVDEHIWGPLAKAKAPIYYVGREPDTFMQWAKDNGRKGASVLAKSFVEAFPGFAAHHHFRPKRA